MANIRETLIGFGKKKQADIATANVLADLWRLNKLNAELCNPKLVTESDGAELGKGHEFDTAVYKSHWDVQATLDKYLSSQWAAWVMAYGLGKVTKTGEGPYTYTCKPLDPVADGTELPYFSMVEQMRPGAGVIFDRMHVGLAVKSWRLTLGSGPGRANSKLAVELVGSGKLVEPSAIALPAATAEVTLPAGSMTLTVIGVDYVTLKNIVSVEAGWDNAARIDSGYFPGSGTQDGAALMGRIEIGDRVPSLSFVARFVNGSAELTKLKALTTGTAVLGLSNGSNDTFTLTYHQVGFRTVDLGDTDGIVTVSVECSPQWHAVNKLLTAEVKTGVDGIGE